MKRCNETLRKSAQGQKCAFQIPGICNYDPETTVLCHLPDDSGTGKMAGKSDDWIAAFGCSRCHDAIDGRLNALDNYLAEEDRQFFMRRAMIRTWRKWMKMGLVRIVEES